MNHIQVNAEAAHEAAHPWYDLRDGVGSKHKSYCLAKAVMTQQRVLTKLQADHSGAVTDMVSCTCGDLYPADSFGAGFIAATGHCQNCDAAEQAEQEPVADYAYQTIEEYEELCGMQVNDAFKIGWNMARTTNAMLGIKAAPVEPVKQEPVAERFEKMHANGDVWITTIAAAAIARNAAPVRTKDLTDDEIHKAFYSKNTGLINGIRDVIAKDREKNK